MRWANDDGGLRGNGEYGDRTKVLRCDPLRSEGADPRVPMACVVVVQLGFGSC